MSGKAEILKMIEGRIETIEKLTQECIELIYKGAYNEAIEAAAKIIDDCNREGLYNAIGGARRIRELKKMSMKNKTLCLYWPQYDKVLNIRRIADGIEFEIKDKRSEIVVINITQMKELKDWIRENNI